MFELPEDLATSLLPFVPRFHHALLDLTGFDPSAQEADPELRMVLHLMKLSRQQQLLQFFEWLAGEVVEQVPDSLLARMLLYALHADNDLDTEKIQASLKSNPELERKAMSVAEKLKAEGRQEGRQEGFWIGRIQTLEEILEKPQRLRRELEGLPLVDLEAIHAALHRDYEVRFKRR